MRHLETKYFLKNYSLNKDALHTTGVWQNGGFSAKLNFCTSINISANLNICTSNPPLRQAPKRYSQAPWESPEKN